MRASDLLKELADMLAHGENPELYLPFTAGEMVPVFALTHYRDTAKFMPAYRAMTEEDCGNNILATLRQFEDDNHVHVTSIMVPTYQDVTGDGTDYGIGNPKIEYEPTNS